MENYNIKTDVDFRELIGDILNKNFILNNKIDDFDSFEKCIHAISLFHCKKNNYDFNDIIVEYSVNLTVGLNVNKPFSKKGYTLSNDNDSEKKNVSPLLSTITTLNDSDYYLFFTNINKEKYMYKEFEHVDFFVLYTNCMKHIVVDHSKIYGSYNYLDKDVYILNINIWEKNTNFENLCEYTKKSKNDDIQFGIDENVESKEFELDNILTFNFYENLIYKNDKNVFNFLDMLDNEIMNNASVSFIEKEVIIQDTNVYSNADKLKNDINKNDK